MTGFLTLMLLSSITPASALKTETISQRDLMRARRDTISEKNGELCALPVGGECGFRIDSLI
jgi:hypothetical protein